MKSVVLIGEYDDEDIARLHIILNRRGVEVSFLPLGLSSQEYRIEWIFGQEPVIEACGTVLNGAVMERSQGALFKLARMDERVLSDYSNGTEAEIDFAHREWDASLLNAIETLTRSSTSPTYGSPRDTSWHHWKPFALHKAIELGIRVPKTIITNSPDLALSNPLVTKSINSNALVEAARYFPTSRLDDILLHSISGQRLEVPSIFQSEVIRESEIRTIVFGENAFERKVKSSSSNVDIKYAEDRSVSSIGRSSRTDALIHLTSSLGLTFCCFDTIVDMTGIEWLVDVTPRGSWHHYETEEKFEISEEVASLLSGETESPDA